MPAGVYAGKENEEHEGIKKKKKKKEISGRKKYKKKKNCTPTPTREQTKWRRESC